MKESVQTQTQVTLEELLTTLVPPSSGGFLKLVSDDSERFFQPLGGRWGALPGQRDGLDSFVVAHPSDSYFSPCSWARPVTPSPMTSCSVLWVVRRYALAAQQRSEPRSRVLDGETERAVESFTRSPRTGFSPSIVIDGGDQAIALWRVEPMIADVAQLQKALDTLSRVFRSQRVDPVEALIPVPGTRCTRVFPAVTVRVVAFEPTRVHPINLDKLIS